MFCPLCLARDVTAFEPLEDDRPALRCPRCGLEGVPLLYPHEYQTHPAVPVAIVGNRGHGKTVFVQSLITHLEETGLGPGSSFGFVAEDGMFRYRRQLRALREQSRLPLQSDSVFPTPEVVRLSNVPHVGGCQLVLYDTGGESFATVGNFRAAGKFVAACPAVVWLVSLKHGDFEHDGEWADRMTVYTQAMVALGADPRDQTLIVALTKGDLLLDRPDLPDEARQFLADDTLDVAAGAYDRLERISAALERWLTAGPHRNAVNFLRSRFRAVRYCVLSALGADPDTSGMVVRVAPRGVLAPLHWLWRESRPAVVVEHGDRRYLSLNLSDAIRDAPSGAAVRLGPFAYELTTRLEITNPVRLCGSPRGGTVIRGRAPEFVVGVGVPVGTTLHVSNLTIERVGWEPGDVVRVARGTAALSNCAVRGGVADGGECGSGVVVIGKAEATAVLANCALRDNQSHGAAVYRVGRLAVAESRASDNGQAGVYAGGAEVRVERCQLTANRHHGVLIRGCGTATVCGSSAVGNGGAGIASTDEARAVLTDNTCERNRGAGISVRLDAVVEVEKNTCAQNEECGISVQDRVTGRVVGNDCRNNTIDGIAVGDSAAVEVSGNECAANTRNGVSFGGAAGGRCAANTCTRNARHGFAVLGTAAPAVEGNTAEDNGGAGFHVRSTAAVTFARTNAAADNAKGNFDPPNLARRSWWG